ncbi:OLC1v1032904C1 [Oldenlandia corymbosa var. corymbosa]|uniref:OLC1v1032904C1 n=1 Tax=Oldenlandia corymbosa var. corymbosa TaxID=529605 RepID=A0AAV1CQ28_OLDCO|nr:OLC1v1032904C1 [Oldenlandia corymbosa var. corymbosa]
MVASWFSIASLYGSFLHRCISSSGLSSQTVTIVHENGKKTRMHYWGPNPESVSPSKPSLVLIHGFGPAGAWQWRPQITDFSRHFNLYVPDLVFFGDHSSTESEERSEIFQAVCVGKLMEEIGVERYSVVGTSYGGFVAYRLAGMWPERVEKVVIASSGVNLTKKDNERLMKRANVGRIEELMLPGNPGQLRTLLSLSVHYWRPYYVPDFVLNDFLQKLYGKNRKEKLELLKGLTLGRDDSPQITPLKQEVLIVWGQNDQIFPLEKAKQLKECLGEKAKLEVLKNASHLPQLEQSGKFNKVVKAFLFAS